MDDTRYMKIALQIAELGRGQASPGPLVGAVIVRDGEIVGQGAFLRPGRLNAVEYALHMAGDLARGATLYVTLEPCIEPSRRERSGASLSCLDAVMTAGISRVVVAASHPDTNLAGTALAKLRDAGLLVSEGVLAKEAMQQNEAFFVWATKSRPFVVWRCSATLDGFIASDSGHGNAVTSDLAYTASQELRRRVAAVAVGVETVLRDNPRLTVRSVIPSGLRVDELQTPAHLLMEFGVSPLGSVSMDTQIDADPTEEFRQPLRVVFDSRLRTPIISDLLSGPGKSVIYTTHQGCRDAGDAYVAGLERSGATVVPITADEHGRVYLPEALQDLAQRGVSTLLLEGGPTLVSSFVQEQLVDKVFYYLAPKILRSGVRATKGPRTERMVEALELERVTYEQIGEDLLVSGYPHYEEKPRWWLGSV